ncbi:MAG: aldo/keto reductase [Candidatus Izemoplasmataceae bacterium]
MHSVKLNNNYEMPIIGLGTFRSKKNDAYNAVKEALEGGYRHIDTAMIYGNEEEVGRAIKDSNIPREEIFVTTKLWNTDQGYEKTLEAFNTSLKNLGLDYIDLYLIHWFKGYDNALSTYRAFETLYEEGKVKAIGVSNFNVHHLMYLMENAKIPPMINQVETHVTLQNHFLHDYCKKNNIQLEAYAPLMSHQIKDLLSNETMAKIAKKHDKTIPQIAIRWLIEREIVVIPKSITPERIVQNFDVFDFTLDEEDMISIRSVNTGKKIFTEFDNVDY